MRTCHAQHARASGKDLKSLSNCLIDELATNEEFAILNLIMEYGRRSPNNLLATLIEPNGNETFFSELYDGIEDLGGEDNFSAFIMTLYKFWLQSSYKTTSSHDVLPYSSKKKFGFYFDNFDVESDDGYLTNKILNDDGEAIGEPYNLYDAIILSKTDLADNDLKIPTQEIPFFYFQAYDNKNHNSNVCSGTGLTFDVVTTFTGIGNLAKLKHLRHLTNLKKLRVLIGTVEVASGTASIILKYTDNCGGTEFCKSLTNYLFWVEVGSLGMDAFTEKMIKKAAKEAAGTAKIVENVDEDIVKHLNEVSESIEVLFSADDISKLCFKKPVNCSGILHYDEFVKNNVDDLLSDKNLETIWSLGPTIRGRIIESILAIKKYEPNGYKFIAGWNYKYIDFDGTEYIEELLELRGEVISLKTFNTTKNGTDALDVFESSLRKSAKALDDATLPKTYSSAIKTLDVTVKEGKYNSSDLLKISEKIKGEFKNIKINIDEL